jgi:hypothetical protein
MKVYRLGSFGDDLAGLPVHGEGLSAPGSTTATSSWREWSHTGVRAGVVPVSDGAGEVLAVGDNVYYRSLYGSLYAIHP